MSPLKTGAVALTLIIAVPIILGFALASEEVEKDVETTENGGGLTDTILNTSSPYYLTYTGANNNNMLQRTFIAQGVAHAIITNPDYDETSATTYSYTPVYNTSNGALSLPSVVTQNYTSSGTQYYGIGVAADVTLPNFAIAELTVNVGAIYPVYTIEYETDSVPGSVNVERTDSFTAIRSGNGYLIFGEGVDDDFEIQCDGFRIAINGQLQISYRTYYAVPDNFPDVWNTTVNNTLALKLTTADGTEYLGYSNATSLTVSYSTVTIFHGTQMDVFANVSEIEFTRGGSTSVIYNYRQSTVSYYADVSYGWTLPELVGNVATDSWMNGYLNGYVRMMIHIEDGEDFILSQSYTDGTPALSVSNTNGFITAIIDNTAYDVGTYTDLMIEVRPGTITVSGLMSWPPISTLPSTTYNSITGTTEVITEDFTRLYISDVSTNSVEIRVDAAEIVAGYFPSTQDKSLDLYDLFPDTKKQSIIIDSVGTYGDYLVIDDTTYTIDGGTITVIDEETQTESAVNILGMTIDYIESEDGTAWTTYVNGNLVTQAANSAPHLYFGGEWSLTLHRAVTTTESIVQSSWVPGEFVLDDNGFVMAMLLTAISVFVVLGMTGGRSGGKVGILALVCGGAVLAGLIII